jgi:hypothetical protein
VPRTSVKRVFILGAGMSVPLGVPAASRLLFNVLKFCAEQGQSNRDLDKFLEYLYPNINSPGGCPNIEDVLALIDVGLSSDQIIRQPGWTNQEIAKIREFLVGAIARYMWSLLPTNSSDATARFVVDHPGPWTPMIELVKNYASGVGVIVTFNWDLNIERAAAFAGMSYSYGEEEFRAQVRIIKPHGSLNWFQIADPVSEKNAGFVRLGANLAYYPYFEYGRFDFVGKGPFIVPPTPFKTFDFPELREMWRQVHSSVRDAEDIAVVGYSLPPEDQLARLVLISAIRANARVHKRRCRIQVVDLNPEIVERFRRLAGTDADVVDGGRSAAEWRWGTT